MARHWLSLAVVFLVSARLPEAEALTLSDGDVAANDSRWQPGSITTNSQNVTNPVPNSNPNWVGAGYDFSSVGWSLSYYNGRSTNLTLIAPGIAATAAHHAIDSSPFPSSPTVEFVGTQNNPVYATVTGTIQLKNNGYAGDVALTTLNRATTDADHVTVARMLDISSRNYVGQSVFALGSNVITPYDPPAAIGQQVGTGVVSGIGNAGSDGLLVSYSKGSKGTFLNADSGDSGSPVFITYKGQLTLLGVFYYPTQTSSLVPMTVGTTSYDPVTPTNAQLAPYGYALRFTIYDVPTDTANTANVWTGGGGSGAFGATANWSKGSVPAALPVVFDGAAAGGQTTVSLAANQAVRGMLFRSTAGGSGFTFTGTNTLAVGTTGIRNESAATQTFSVPVTLSGAQNWEAEGGNLVFNGTVANGGNLLVVQGAKDTTLNGVISGAGGFAKDGVGVATLNAANTYSGTTFIHDGTVRMGVNNAISSSSVVQFDAANPTANFDLNGHSQSIGGLRSSLQGTGTVTMGTAGLTTGSANQTETYAGVFAGSGTLTKTGGGTWTLTGDSSGTFSGNIVVNQGALFLGTTAGSATGTGTVTLASGNFATLGGTGLIAGSVIQQAGTYLSPGTGGIGTLAVGGNYTWNGGSTFIFELGASGAGDRLDLGSGSLIKGTGTGYSLRLTDLGGASGLYTLATFGSTTFTAADFSLSSLSTVHGTFILNANSLQFQLAAVPEPDPWILLASGAVLLALAAARRRATA
ncbi:autotransporter-associated beta strand repeat-containing protein [Verrucomicrobium sp. GAS474]|uniref:beta strand repeat-containing protein n=1 Tax=Verrucomicrobium sp. GAS474 TaxID=1882831 RepID=UPI00087A5ADE|nr:autotransporter-associated beta strand repeat-containing protein [Verrucomicrobium sp. GAS474]SDT99141.1 autotransporter-associated beta strand repeat-containing protein [Verrucomicrobium sp. GAS474]